MPTGGVAVPYRRMMPARPLDVTRSASSALATHGEAYSEVAQASGDDETDPA